jgi:hypothetical protein
MSIGWIIKNNVPSAAEIYEIADGNIEININTY